MLKVNDYIDKYRLISEVGSGTYGIVYQAQHTFFTNRIVAIKFMHALSLQNAQERDLFLEEARLLEMVKHPHILSIIDVGMHEGLPYLVTEYAGNGSLADYLKRQQGKPLPVEEALTILSQIGQALHYAHQQNIVHRDLKPENILFKAKGDVLLADFGIAKILTTVGIRQGTVAGTPAYMAPEQWQGLASRESDQYALGCIAYELFTGRRPFVAANHIAMMWKQVQEHPVPPRQYNPDLPMHIEQAILKALAKKPEDRFPSVLAFTEALLNALPYNSMAPMSLAASKDHLTASSNQPPLRQGQGAIILPAVLTNTTTPNNSLSSSQLSHYQDRNVPKQGFRVPLPANAFRKFVLLLAFLSSALFFLSPFYSPPGILSIDYFLLFIGLGLLLLDLLLVCVKALLLVH